MSDLTIAILVALATLYFSGEVAYAVVAFFIILGLSLIISISDWLSNSNGSSSVENDNTSPSRNNVVTRRVNNNPRFRIVSETNVSSGRQRSSGRIKVNAVTRPKQCIVCRTEGSITRLDSGQWKCTVCEHTWR